jgi:hypothetical protein
MLATTMLTHDVVGHDVRVLFVLEDILRVREACTMLLLTALMAQRLLVISNPCNVPVRHKIYMRTASRVCRRVESDSR